MMRAGVSRGVASVAAPVVRLLEAPVFPLLCFGVYIALRAGVLLVGPIEQTSDVSWYFQRGASIAAGAGYIENGVPTAFWPVGWPAFLGGVYAITGPSILAGQLANLVLSALVFGLTLLLARALIRDRLIGRAAVLLLTFYPNQIGYVPWLSAEILYQFLLLLALWLMVLTRGPGTALLAGLAFGAATLTKTQTLLIPGFLLLGAWLAAPSRAAVWRLLRPGVLIYFGILVVVAPWSWRNHAELHAFIPVSTNGGWTLLTGNNPEANGDYTPDTELAHGISHDPARQVEMDRLANARAVAWIEAHPARFLMLLPRKVFRLWVPDGEAEWYYQLGMRDYPSHATPFRMVRLLNQAYYFALWLLALPALWWSLRDRASAGPWLTLLPTLVIYFSLVSMAFSGQARFHYSLMPLVAIYAGWSLLRAANSAGATDTTWAESPIGAVRPS